VNLSKKWHHDLIFKSLNREGFLQLKQAMNQSVSECKIVTEKKIFGKPPIFSAFTKTDFLA